LVKKVIKNYIVLQLETALATLVTTWFTLAERLDTAALTSVSLMLLGRRNATTGGSGNNLAKLQVLSPIATRTSVP
jgi:hypothetical protein